LASILNREKKWNISPIHIPNGIHLSLTLANCNNAANQLAIDVKEAIASLKANPPKKSSTGAIYGATASLPNDNMG
jgi:hypothetical protein